MEPGPVHPEKESRAGPGLVASIVLEHVLLLERRGMVCVSKRPFDQVVHDQNHVNIHPKLRDRISWPSTLSI